MFDDRWQAGRRLAEALPPLDRARTLVLALPRGGVPVAASLCRELGLPLDLALVSKIGLPGHEECAIGAVVDGRNPQIVVNTDLARMSGLSREDVEALGVPKLREIERRRRRYMGNRVDRDLAGLDVILVDDGIATGATMRAAIKAARTRHAERVRVAVPVASREAYALLADEADRMVCLETPSPFLSVGSHYRSFPQVSDEEVVSALASVVAPTDTAGNATAI